MVTLEMGAVKFRSVKAAYEAAKKKQPELKYITFYMRYRMGMGVQKAMKKPVRKYERKSNVQCVA